VRKHAPEDLRVFFHREYDPFGRRVYAPGQTPSRRWWPKNGATSRAAP
jgi:hypothetical protein